MPWVCNECGIVKEIKIHGYSLEARILEDVYFLATYDDNDKLIEVKIHPEYDDGYWHDLNTKKWLKEAKSYASNCANLEDCAKCNDEVVLDPIDDEGNPILEAHKFTKYVEVPLREDIAKELFARFGSNVAWDNTPDEIHAIYFRHADDILAIISKHNAIST